MSSPIHPVRQTISSTHELAETYHSQISSSRHSSSSSSPTDNSIDDIFFLSFEASSSIPKSPSPRQNSTVPLDRRLSSNVFIPRSFRETSSRRTNESTLDNNQKTAYLVQKKLENLLPQELESSKLVEFLNQRENKKTLKALKENREFCIGEQNVLTQLNMKAPLEFIFDQERYFCLESIPEGHQGFFEASGSLKRVNSVLTRGLDRTANKVSYAIQKVLDCSYSRSHEIENLLDRTWNAYRNAANLAEKGLSLVSSKIYRTASKLIILQPFAPSLATKLASGISLSEALKILLDTSQAVADLHKKDFIHRDLKPANFSVQTFQTTEEEPELFNRYFLNDFDTLESIETARKDIPVGTPCYMAPEVCLLYTPPQILFFTAKNPEPNTSLDLKRSDIWSFGMSALEILFHTENKDLNKPYPAHPFIDITNTEIENSHGRALMIKISSLKDETSIDLWVEQCIERQPHLEIVYRLVRDTLHLDPQKRMNLEEFHAKLKIFCDQ